MRSSLAAGILSVLAALPAAASEPLSAIDWLSDSIAAPPVPEPSGPALGSAPIPEIETLPLGRQLPDAVGLLSAEAAGVPRTLWRGATTDELAALIAAEPRDLLPAPRALLKRLLLAELDPPGDADETGRLLVARIDRLLEFGALDEAAALLDVAGTMTEELFRRRFDVALLTGSEEAACAELRDDPSISPTFPARIFCLARTEEWRTAAVTLETAKALDLISEEEDDLLARFLHPELEEELPPLGPPLRPSPLVFRLYEAVGEPLPTSPLPLPFAHADLNPNAGWKAQLEAAERLARAGSIAPNRLLGLYSQQRPSASGGVWERVRAVQALDAALAAGNGDVASKALVDGWALFQPLRLEPMFAEIFAPRLDAAPLNPEARALAFRMSLLTGDYLIAAARHEPRDAQEAFLTALALGRTGTAEPPDRLAKALADGFAATRMPVRFGAIDGMDGRGRALLRAIALFTSGTKGNFGDLRDAITLMRMLGFETTARRAALELLILSDPA
jgi:hypothetical protein